MTCVVGISTPDGVWIGSDSEMMIGWNKSYGNIPGSGKVFRNGEFLFGVSGEYVAINMLEHRFNPPDRTESKSDMAYMAGVVIPGIRNCMENDKILKFINGVASSDSNALIGYRKSLYFMCGSLSISQVKEWAIGSGSSQAIGALQANQHLEPKERVKQAISAARDTAVGVGGEIHVEKL